MEEILLIEGKAHDHTSIRTRRKLVNTALQPLPKLFGRGSTGWATCPYRAARDLAARHAV
jgi:hypothetical protein